MKGAAGRKTTVRKSRGAGAWGFVAQWTRPRLCLGPGLGRVGLPALYLLVRTDWWL